MQVTLERLGDVTLPIDYQDGIDMTQAEKFEVVRKVGALVLEQDPELITSSGDLANRIKEVTGAGIPFSIAAIHSMGVARIL